MSKNRHPAIHVASARDGFRRGGHEFGIKPKTIPLGELHPHAYAAITGDKSLVVVHTAVDLDEAQAAALPHADAPHVIDALENASTLTLNVGADDAARVLALDEREANLKQRELVVAERESALASAQAEFDQRVTTFDSERAAHAQSVADFEREKEAHAAQSKAAQKK